MFALPLLLMSLSTAEASVDPKCEGKTQKFEDDLDQQQFILNYVALSTSFSPIHAPKPLAESTTAAGLEFSLIPPLSCEQRLVLNSTKTEDTNKVPVMPRPRFTFTLPTQGKALVPYGSFAFLPPVPLGGVRTLLLSSEIGFGIERKSGTQYGSRFHVTSVRTIGEVATPFNEEDEPAEDIYVGSTFGLDIMFGKKLASGLTPYLALGLTDVSTFFYIGDDGYVGNNYDPFFGPVTSLGADKSAGNWNFAGELYAVPGLTYVPPSFASQEHPEYCGWHFTPGGYVYTVRLRVSYVF